MLPVFVNVERMSPSRPWSTRRQIAILLVLAVVLLLFSILVLLPELTPGGTLGLAGGPAMPGMGATGVSQGQLQQLQLQHLQLQQQLAKQQLFLQEQLAAQQTLLEQHQRLHQLDAAREHSAGAIEGGVGLGASSARPRAQAQALEAELRQQQELLQDLERQQVRLQEQQQMALRGLQQRLEGQPVAAQPNVIAPHNRVQRPPPPQWARAAAAVPIVAALEPGQRSFETALSVVRRQRVRDMMVTAWSGYAKYALGDNEFSPVRKTGHSAGIFGKSKMGATVVDALDTLLIMGLDAEAAVARNWIAQHLNFDVEATVSVFEICIRFVGGLLSAYAMTGDDMFKTKAHEIATRLLPAFNTKTGIPKALINLRTGATKNYPWASGGASILSEFGTMQLEFEYLSTITGDSTFAELTRKVMKIVLDTQRPANGLYPNYLHPETGKWGSADTSLGALGDSFYEYLLKLWVYHGGRSRGDGAGRGSFDEAMTTVRDVLHMRSAQSDLLYIAETRRATVVHKMGHLACFVGGLYALAVKGAPAALQASYLASAEGVTNTCRESYRRSATGLGPEMMHFDAVHECTTSKVNERYYILRPETVESYFYMWRLTHDDKYREWAWQAVEAIEEHARCGEGYCGVKDVEKNPAPKDDVQQSFFLAETLKYLYLIFCDDNVLSLDKWVLNTEAHPLPIQAAP